MLYLGSRGSEVIWVQAKLLERGFSVGPIDGIFGLKTQAAVKMFQVSVHLTADGIVGPMTVSALQTYQEIKPVAPLDPNQATLESIDARFKKGTPEWYEAAFRIAVVDSNFKQVAHAAALNALKLKADYEWGESRTGVPWDMILGVHLLECNNNPMGVLHNGQLIVGTGRTTTIVPIGRGPFATFRDSIMDAVRLQGLLNSVRPEAWTLGMKLKQCELFNGAGYLMYHSKENSPYLWSMTNINDGTGKYVSDGKWDEYANADAQVGVVAVLKALEEIGEWKPNYSA